MSRWEEAAGQVRAAMAASEGLTGEEEQVIAGAGPSFLIAMLTRLERWSELEEFAKERLAKARGRMAVELRMEAAAALQRQGRAGESMEQLREAVKAAQACEQERHELMARSLQCLGAAALDTGDLAVATEAFGGLRTVAREFPETDPDRPKWDLLGAVGLAQGWVAEGNAAAAAALLHDVVEAVGETVSEEIRAKSLYLLAGALLTAGHFAPARRRARQALTLWQAAGDGQARMANDLLDSIMLQETLAGAADSTDSSTGE
jgi:tetratricopeptide (TPR) repeat protein